MNRLPLFLVIAGSLLTNPVLATPSKAPDRPVDAPQISRSRGVDGGIVLLWPRILPNPDSVEARRLGASVQTHLASMIRSLYPGRAIDIRPEPERACPMNGCRGTAVGAVILQDDRGTAVLATISPPGPSDLRLIPWTGHVRLQRNRVPFREPPESYVTVTDFALTDAVDQDLASGDPAVRDALRSELGGTYRAASSR